MKKSPIHPGYDLGDYSGCAIDPREDFSQFLEEAKQHARETSVHFPSPYPQRALDKKLEVKKSKKSWQSSLLSWWKADRRNKPRVESVHSSHVPKRKHSHVSGPIHGSKEKIDIKHRGPISGPLTSFFIPIKKVDNEMAYMCLDKLSSSHGVKNYGPVYSVS